MGIVDVGVGNSDTLICGFIFLYFVAVDIGMYNMEVGGSYDH